MNSLGTSLGALLLWPLGKQLHRRFPDTPRGTLSANLIGGDIIGVAIAHFSQVPAIAPDRRPLIVTGSCGGHTTFSTFCAMVEALRPGGRVSWPLGSIAIHVSSSLFMTVLGLASWERL